MLNWTSMFLRVWPNHATFIHLAAADPGSRRGWTRWTLCGLPWRKVADDAAEVEALLRGLARERFPGSSVCPLCATLAVDQLAAETVPTHASK